MLSGEGTSTRDLRACQRHSILAQPGHLFPVVKVRVGLYESATVPNPAAPPRHANPQIKSQAHQEDAGEGGTLGEVAAAAVDLIRLAPAITTAHLRGLTSAYT